MNFRALWAIYIHEMSRAVRTLGQSLVSPVITTSLYFVVFGTAIGSRIQVVDGVDYASFIVPGLIMLTILTQAVSNAAFGIFFPKFIGSVYELLSAPVSFLEIVIGFVGAAATKSLVIGLVILITSTLFVDLRIDHPGWMFAILVVACFTFALLGFIVGTMVAAYIRRPSQVLLGSIILVGLVIVYSSAAQELGVKYMRFEAASTVEGRFREIETAWLTFVEYPLFGAGLGAMFEVDGFYKAFVHNMAMYHLWKFGLVGTALLIAPLVMIGRQLRSSSPRLRSYAIGGALGVTAYLVTCAAYKTYYLVWIYGVVVGAGLSWLSAWRMRQDEEAAAPVSEE